MLQSGGQPRLEHHAIHHPTLTLLPLRRPHELLEDLVMTLHEARLVIDPAAITERDAARCEQREARASLIEESQHIIGYA